MKNLFLIAFSIFVFSCKDLPSPPDQDNLSFSREDSIEARELAVWFSGELTAPDSIVTEFLHSLRQLRATFKDSSQLIPNIQSLLANRFLTPWATKTISLKFDSSTAELVRNNQYNGWSLLDPSIRPDSVSRPYIIPWCSAFFSRLFNPWRLVESYSKLPGVVYAVPDFRGFAGGTYPMFPGTYNAEMSYIFVRNHSSIPGPYHYFYYDKGKPYYAGIFSRQANPRPPWWDQARISIDSLTVWQRYR